MNLSRKWSPAHRKTRAAVICQAAGMGQLALVLALGLIALSPRWINAQDAPSEEEAEKKSAWQRSASLGLTLTKGNSETLLFAASAEGNKAWDKNEVNLGAFATYGEHEDQDTGQTEKDNESFRGFAQYNRLLTERLFGYARAEIFHDGVADIAYRVTLSPGLGYYFIKNEKTTLRGEVGPGYVIERQEGGGTDDYLTLRLADRFEHKINDRARVWQSAEFLPEVDDFDNYIINAEVGVEADLTKKLSLRVVVQDSYDNEPAPGRKTNDLKLITALALKF